MNVFHLSCSGAAYAGCSHTRSPEAPKLSVRRKLVIVSYVLLGKLKCFEGIPYPYSERKRQVVPEALKYLRIQQYRKFCILGDLCHLIGWKYQDLVKRLEEKRKTKSSLWYQNKQA